MAYKFALTVHMHYPEACRRYSIQHVGVGVWSPAALASAAPTAVDRQTWISGAWNLLAPTQIGTCLTSTIQCYDEAYQRMLWLKTATQ